jgi:hypothetical protein
MTVMFGGFDNRSKISLRSDLLMESFELFELTEDLNDQLSFSDLLEFECFDLAGDLGSDLGSDLGGDLGGDFGGVGVPRGLTDLRGDLGGFAGAG